MDEDFHIELNKKNQQQNEDQFSTAATEPSAIEAAGPEETKNYAPPESCPDSAAKTSTSLKEVNIESISDDMNSEVTNSSQGTDECPTVVVTAITAGDTPTSDDDHDIKEEKEEGEQPPKEDIPSEEEEEKEINPDAFECSFGDDFGSQPMTTEPQDLKEKTSEEPQPAADKMEVNGTDEAVVTRSAETTG